jgi:hypothetical protein
VDPDPAIFVIDLQDANKKLIYNIIFSAYYFLKVYLHHFSKIKSQKEPQISRNQGFSYYFCMMIEGSGSIAGSGYIPLTSGSGSGRPKNMWIRNTDAAVLRDENFSPRIIPNICHLPDPPYFSLVPSVKADFTGTWQIFEKRF